MVTNSLCVFSLFKKKCLFVWNTICDGGLQARVSRVSRNTWVNGGNWSQPLPYLDGVSIKWSWCGWTAGRAVLGMMRIVLVRAHTYSLVHTERLHRGMCYEAIALLISLSLVAAASVEKSHSDPFLPLLSFDPRLPSMTVFPTAG